MLKKRRRRYIQVAQSIGQRLGLKVDPNDWPTIWALIAEHGEPSYVYAVVDRQAGLVKFGRSVNPGQRLASLQTANGRRLQLWGYCRERGDLTESAVHRQLKEHRVSGEWFRLNDKTGAVIDTIRSMRD
jgi:hypothetical protein